MAHQSEGAKPLCVVRLSLQDSGHLPAPDVHPAVWLFILPYGRSPADSETGGAWFDRLHSFAGLLPDDSVLCLLTTPADAATTVMQLTEVLHFQLWVAVKLREPVANPGLLPGHHAALLILTKYTTSLRHNKTRIAYTYCPACDKTTKDYGGKKHTYHEYGTLMSDVWRDIDWAPDGETDQITDRLSEVFGRAPYTSLHVLDLTAIRSLRSTRSPVALLSDDNAGPSLQSSRLLNGDSVALLSSIASNSIDFCFADPPYNIAKQYDAWDDTQDKREYFSWCDRWLDELARVLKPGRTCAVLNIPQWAARHFLSLKHRLTFQNWIVWEGLGLPVRKIMPAHYAILCCSKGPPRPLPGMTNTEQKTQLSSLKEWYCLRAACVKERRRLRLADRETISDLWWDIHRLKHNARRVDHPCQLPPALMRRLIALFTCEGESVLDPFNGAGTTSLCAEQLGRKFIGIELSETYHQLALSRHETLRQGEDPFAKATRNLQAKNSRVRRIGGIDYKVSKKVLQLEVRNIARHLGRLPTRAEVKRLSRHPIDYFDDYFIGWGEVCAAARTTGMTENRTADRSDTMQSRQPSLFD